MGKLEEAIILATQAHAGQVDKGGAPYIFHPLRVMMAMTSEQDRIVAVLHDVVEDSDYELTNIASQFGVAVYDAVDALTRRDGETYEAFVERCSKNTTARRVKLADLADNMDLKRLGRDPTAEDARRFHRYNSARAYLTTFGDDHD